MISNSKLYQMCEQWISACIRYLQTLPSWPGYEDFELEFPEDRRFATSKGATKIHVEEVWRINEEKLINLSEYKLLTEFILSDPKLSSVLLGDKAADIVEVKTASLGWVFRTFLIEYLTRTQKIVFSQNEYNDVYESLEKYIYDTEPMMTTTLYHLRNVKIGMEKISIGKRVFLRQSTYEEKKMLLEGGQIYLV